MATIEDEEFYHGLLPREDAKSLLKNPGDYLLRSSEPKLGEARQLILSSCLRQSNQPEPLTVKHFKIDMVNNKYTLDNVYLADSLVQLIDAYKAGGKSLTTEPDAFLKIPIPRAAWELSHENIKIGDILGEGTFGSVNKGVLSLPGRAPFTVALKCAKTEEVNKEKICEMMKEARLMRNFDHPNVVKLYGVAVAKEPLLIVMEYICGGDLHSLLVKKKETKADKLRFISHAAWGVEYLHSKNCIHRDLAARNCLLAKHKTLKISDFGLSREGATYTIHTVRMIPIRWLAPEILKSSTYTHKSDVWTFGVLMWEIYADGEEPYKGKTNAEVKELLLAQKTNPVPKDTPKEVSNIMQNICWVQEPDTRGTMQEVVRTMEKIKGVQPLAGETPTKKSIFSTSKSAAVKTTSVKKTPRVKNSSESKVNRK